MASASAAHPLLLHLRRFSSCVSPLASLPPPPPPPLPARGRRSLTLALSSSVAGLSPRRRNGSSFRCFSGVAAALTPELRTTLDRVVASHKVVLFMKGTKDFPQCGFSHTVVRILNSLNVPFEALNILDNDLMRQAIKDYSNWPTFPQLYIGGEFFGGCDITVEAYKSGELQELLEKTLCS